MKRTHKERRELSRKIATNGDTEFPESELYPQTSDNLLPHYGVTWFDEKGRLTGNSWRSKVIAEKVRDNKIQAGTFAGTCTSYCAGFAF